MSFSINAAKNITGIIDLPTSKSISNRALIIRAYSHNNIEIYNLADCDDTDVMIKALSTDDYLKNIGAAGTSMRFLTAFLALQTGKWEITGTERMKNRPISVLVDALNQLGANIKYKEKEGFPPLEIIGNEINGGKININGNISSQYISALLMAGPCMRNGLEITITGNLISKPYAEMTLKMMEYFGIRYAWNGNQILIARQDYRFRPFTIEGDWSAASYWYEILSLAESGSLKLKGLKKDSLQGDSKIADYFESLGIRTTYGEGFAELTKSEILTGFFSADLEDQPDLAQTIVVTCLLKNIPFKITGLQTLKIKETDRISALINESKKLGYVIKEHNDNSLIWDGERCEKEESISIATYEDHRMAMSFAPASFKYDNLIIEHPEVVSKSYPGYWKDLETCGFVITKID